MVRGVDIVGRGKSVQGRAAITGDAIPDSPPDSALEQWTAEAYNDSTDEWVGQLGVADLTGGSATKTTDANGNTVVRYNATDGQEHSTTGVTLAYDRAVIAVVFRTNSTGSDQVIVSDTALGDRYLRTVNGTEYGIIFGGSEQNAGTVDTNLHLGIVYGPRFGSTTNDELEIDGTTVIDADAGSNGYSNGIMLGGYGGGGLDPDADVLELVVYQDPTQDDIDDERMRLEAAYSGLSF